MCPLYTVDLDIDIVTAVGLVGLALAIGTFGTIIGAGGGFLLVPALAVLFGLDGVEAVGTAALTLGLIRITGAVGYHRQGLVRWPIAGWFALGSGPVALLSGWLLTKRIDSDALLAIIGALLVALAMVVVVRYRADHRRSGEDQPEPPNPRPIPLWLGGSAVGVLNGTFAVGGGLVAVPYLARVQRLTAHQAAATTTAAGMVGSAAATIGHTINGTVHWAFAPLLFVGAVAGSWVGARWAGRLSERTVMSMLAGGLVVAGVPLLLTL